MLSHLFNWNATTYQHADEFVRFGTNFKNAVELETGPCIENDSRTATSTSLYCGCTKME